MLFNQLKTTFRSLIKSKSYLLLNVLGLAPGLLLFMIMAIYAANELSYDQYHEKADRLYRVYKEDIGNDYRGTNKYAVMPTPLAPTMKEEYPEVLNFARVNYSSNRVVKVGEEVYLEPLTYMADPSIFDLFSLELIAGSRETVLNAPDAAVIS